MTVIDSRFRAKPEIWQKICCGSMETREITKQRKTKENSERCGVFVTSLSKRCGIQYMWRHSVSGVVYTWRHSVSGVVYMWRHSVSGLVYVLHHSDLHMLVEFVDINWRRFRSFESILEIHLLGCKYATVWSDIATFHNKSYCLSVKVWFNKRASSTRNNRKAWEDTSTEAVMHKH